MQHGTIRRELGTDPESSLQRNEENIIIHLYDKKMEVFQDDSDQSDLVKKHYKKVWLGALKIPLKTLFLNKKVSIFLGKKINNSRGMLEKDTLWTKSEHDMTEISHSRYLSLLD